MALETTLLFDFGLVILAGTVVGLLARGFKQPLLVGYILAGIAIGPIGLSLVQDLGIISALSELGIAFLLFAIGMQIDFSRLAQFKKEILIGGISQVILTALVVVIAAPLLGTSFIESVYLGLIVAFSSSVLAIKMLTDAKQLNSLEGKLIIGYALVQDVLAVLILPVLANPETIFSTQQLLQTGAGFAALVVTGYLLSRFVFPRVTSTAAKTEELFFLTIVSSCFVFLFLSAQLKFPLAVGAFIGGLALSRIPFSLEAQNNIAYLRDLFGTVFFVSLGLQLTSPATLLANPLFWLLLLTVFILNPLIFAGINLVLGFGLQTSLLVGLALFQASEFSFILARQGLALGQIPQTTFDTAVWVILLSMIATPYMTKLHHRLYPLMKQLFRFKEQLGFLERKLRPLQKLPAEVQLQDHVLIIGAGVFGEQLATALHQTEQVLVIEQDPDIVQKMLQQQIPAVYASKNNIAILEKIGIEHAKILVVTVPENATAVRLVQMARTQNASAAIFTRAHHYHDALALYNAGADLVILPQVLASNYCLTEIEKTLQTGKRPRPGLPERFLEMRNDAKL